jgi:hypothetical protein
VAVDPTARDPGGYGEGARHVGTTEVTTDGAGHADFSATLPGSVAGDFVTSTASRVVDGDLETSEFSRSLVATSGSGPLVRRVFVNATGWAPGFRIRAQQTGQGSMINGVAVPAGPQQLAPLPWLRVNQIGIEFNETVEVRPQQLTVRGRRVADYPVLSATLDPNNAHTAMFTLERPIENDRVVLRLDGSSAAAVSAGSLKLDGEWDDGAGAYPSGDGTPGGDFVFRMNLLPGDVNRSGAVLADDFSEVKRKFFSSTSSPGSGPGGYSIFHDVNGSGSILADDFSEVKRRFFNTLPAGEPGASAASAPLRQSPVRRDVLDA